MEGMDRRRFVAAGGAVALGAAAPAWAGPSAPSEGQNAGWYRFDLGDIRVTIASDGHLRTPTTLLGVNVERADVEAVLEREFLDLETNYAHTNHVVAEVGDAKVLIDVGSGDRFQPTAGRLLENLEAAAIDPASITHVVLTHAHPDHVWGMLDDFGDAPRIPEALYAMGQAEFDWWMTEGRVNDVPEMFQAMVVGAQNALSPVAERITFLGNEGEVAPGVRLLSTPGHTVGHMSVLLESGSERLLVTGDAISHSTISFEQPDWRFGFDFDQEQAAQTRRRLLDMAATERMPVLGYHFPFPGLGHVARDGAAYRFAPMSWRWSA